LTQRNDVSRVKKIRLPDEYSNVKNYSDSTTRSLVKFHEG